MRPKNAALNLEPILQRERERKKREKNTRVLCYKGKDYGVYTLCLASTTFARTTTTQNRETVVKVVADPSSSFSSFSAAGPRLVSLKFVRSLAFSLDVINYPL